MNIRSILKEYNITGNFYKFNDIYFYYIEESDYLCVISKTLKFQSQCYTSNLLNSTWIKIFNLNKNETVYKYTDVTIHDIIKPILRLKKINRL